MTEFDKAFVAEAQKALTDRTDLDEIERNLLQHQIKFIEAGTVCLTGPDTVDQWLERYRNHYP